MKIFSCFFLCFSVVSLNNISADGGLVPSPSHYVYEGDQIGIVKWSNSTEELILRVEFHGDVNDFAWIVPLPAEPAVDSVSTDIFYQLRDYSRPLYKRRGSGCNDDYIFGWGRYEDDEGEFNDGVEEVGSGTVGVLEYLILLADDPSALADYLTEHGYEYPSGATSIFNYYISKDWKYFFCSRVDTSLVNGSNGYYYGYLGIKFTFTTSMPVYPLKITSLSYEEGDVTLYSFLPYKATFTDAKLKFAKKITDVGEISEYFPAIAEFIDEGCFLTKLARHFSKDELDDISIEQASDNEEYREVIFYSGIPLDTLFFAFIIPVYLVRRRKRRKNG